MTDYYSGQKVVCISALGNWRLTVNKIYTVDRPHTQDGHAGLFLLDCEHGIKHVPFDCTHFEPANKRKTDISVFSATLPSCSRQHLE